ncbi:hypothetical protein [Bradyrhizobium sp.]|uniref:hypothetical protein n=1 Tax=Bradyrhizobium sp. TaxID=376 RepID=UPI002C0D9C08|nr:hypothetical protein [Bradyrhizobium sp.]HMM88587.1 hypothetical protein [Bradyrhizobium sp.]
MNEGETLNEGVLPIKDEHPSALHFIERLNATFTVLNICKFLAFLRGRINCAEIVAP